LRRARVEADIRRGGGFPEASLVPGTFVATPQDGVVYWSN
jgi:hypothetical protein